MITIRHLKAAARHLSASGFRTAWSITGRNSLNAGYFTDAAHNHLYRRIKIQTAAKGGATAWCQVSLARGSAAIKGAAVSRPMLDFHLNLTTKREASEYIERLVNELPRRSLQLEEEVADSFIESHSDTLKAYRHYVRALSEEPTLYTLHKSLSDRLSPESRRKADRLASSSVRVYGAEWHYECAAMSMYLGAQAIDEEDLLADRTAWKPRQWRLLMLADDLMFRYPLEDWDWMHWSSGV